GSDEQDTHGKLFRKDIAGKNYRKLRPDLTALLCTVGKGQDKLIGPRSGEGFRIGDETFHSGVAKGMVGNEAKKIARHREYIRSSLQRFAHLREVAEAG